MIPRLRTVVLATVAGLALALVSAAPAAAVTVEQKLSVLSSWSQPNSTSYNGWNSARLNQGAWAEYAFDWSTDFCSTSPDQPLGFDFRLPCWRHDFGYRNYKAMNAFSANKSRIDDSFYFDLKTKCATYSIWVRSACYSLAWSYYQAVRTFGGAAVSTADLNRAAKLKQDGLTAQARANRPG
jgi:opacity protein-like surface antigen